MGLCGECDCGSYVEVVLWGSYGRGVVERLVGSRGCGVEVMCRGNVCEVVGPTL